MSASPTSPDGPDLRAWLDALFREGGGWIPFERFMAEALYHPEFGYYPRHIRTVGGSRGDFATSATLSTLLGEAIAAWVVAESDALGLKAPVPVIEIGGGEGSLMREVIAALDRRAGCWKRLLPGGGDFRFHLVEISPRLRQRQGETLSRHRRRIRWHDGVASALAMAGGNALVFSNELADAFPVIALRREAGGGWSELAVAFDPERGLREVSRPLEESRPELPRDAFSVFAGTDWPEGQRVELHDSFRRWQADWMPSIRRGASLIIDYGADDPRAIYHRRPGGTLRAYYRHQRLTGAGLYRMFGRQDLTADVCFGDLARWGEALGWSTTLNLSQADFLRQFAGDACSAAATEDRAAAFLLEPEGAGEAFRVLAQRGGP